MSKKSYYDILGISKDATADDIKKAYRKMSLKYHPDKQAGKTDTEKKAAEEKFKEVNEAYETLSDSSKRAEYDNPGFNFNGSWNGFDPFEGMKSHFGGFGNPFGTRAATASPGNDCTANLNITLEDIYKGRDIKVSYMREERCEYCHGEGGEGVEECPYCHGTGMITEIRQQGFMTMQSSHPCPHCHGTGKIIKHKCSHCDGKGLKPNLATHVVHLSEIPIEYLLERGTRINIGRYGSQSKDQSMPDGNLILLVNLTYDTSVWAIKGKDVYKKVKIPVVDMLLGTEIKVDLPDKSTIKVKIPECSHHGKMLRLTGKGISGTGDFYVVIESQFPEKLTKDQKKYLEKIR